MLDLLTKNWKLRVWCSLFHFFKWFARFQILIRETKSIRRKLLVLSWLYPIFPPSALITTVIVLTLLLLTYNVRRKESASAGCIDLRGWKTADSSTVKWDQILLKSYFNTRYSKILTSFKFHDTFPQFFCKGRMKKMKIENVSRNSKLVVKSKKLIPLCEVEGETTHRSTTYYSSTYYPTFRSYAQLQPKIIYTKSTELQNTLVKEKKWKWSNQLWTMYYYFLGKIISLVTGYLWLHFCC